jgi:hypothetical protein
MVEIEKFKSALKLAAKYREDSYNKIKTMEREFYIESKNDYYCSISNNQNKYYTVSLSEACSKASQEIYGNNNMTTPLYLLLKYHWGDIMIYAEYE